jgi:phage gpG-like protein
VPLTGDDAALRRLRARLATVGAAPRSARPQLAAEALGRVHYAFAASRAPGGAAWARLRYRAGRPLVLTGRLFGSLRSRVTTTGVAVSTSRPYAAFHQFGTRRVPARPFFPAEGELPPPWREAFERVVDAAIRAHFAR